ncbi:MAG TPA: GNAT family N-acetyltransferase [Candidatus Limiplasma sp.]|nr:GNAT family N-acetyltransferase [Candidatus Limiplasma sp.]
MKWFGIRREKSGLPANAYPPLQTERLVMRMFQPGDAMDVFDYARSPIVGAMAGWAPHKTLLESQQVVRRFISRGDVWAIVEKRTGHVIGSIGLHTDS